MKFATLTLTVSICALWVAQERVLDASAGAAGVDYQQITILASEPSKWQSGPPIGLHPATMHAGTSLTRDAIPFVGKVILQSSTGVSTQFTCVLTGPERRDCVTTAHSFLPDRPSSHRNEGNTFEEGQVGLTVEFEPCSLVYSAEEVHTATTIIDPVTEANRERDVAIIHLSQPVCNEVQPAVLLPRLDRRIAERWLLPGSDPRVPVTIAAYYLDCTLGIDTVDSDETCNQYSSTGYIDGIAYLGGEPIYVTNSIGTLPGSSGAPGLVIDTGLNLASRHDDAFYWVCLNVGHRPGGENACIALENGSFAREFIERLTIQ